jgi:hypothetical protein
VTTIPNVKVSIKGRFRREAKEMHPFIGSPDNKIPIYYLNTWDFSLKKDILIII